MAEAYITHVALAAQGADLWAMWIKNDHTNNTYGLYGSRIANAYNSNGPPSAPMSENLVQSINSIAGGVLDLQADWDDYLDGTFVPGPTQPPPAPTPTPVPGLPRVVFVDDQFHTDNSPGGDGTPELVGARVTLFASGEPSGLEMSHRIDDLSVSPLQPAFAVNRFDGDRFPGLAPDARGFVGYMKKSVSSPEEVWSSPLTLDVSGDDVYGPTSLAGNSSRESAVAPRAFGLPRYARIIFAGVEADRVRTDDLVFDAAAETSRGYPHLEAERAHKDNLYLVHCQKVVDVGASTELDLYQLQP